MKKVRNKRVRNFSAGPATLPLSVLEQVQNELLDYKGTGMGVMEMSHRSPEFDAIINGAVDDCRKLLAVPDNYKIIFLQGGATTQFSAVVMNLLKDGKCADYLVTGGWSLKAYKEAVRLRGKDAANVVASNMDGGIAGTHVPPRDSWKLSENASYFFYCANETVHGVQVHDVPDVPGIIVADYSSCFMSAPIPIEKFGVVFAGAQKNVGPAGVTVVIVKEDLLGQAPNECPLLMDWSVTAAKNSMYNTPPTFSIYVMALVFKWLLDNGGLAVMEKTNLQKAKLLYDTLEKSKIFNCPVAAGNRSIMNVRFGAKTPEMEADFIKKASEADLKGLKGHRSIGGIRASIYNAQSLEGVQELVQFMASFEKSC